MLPTKFRFILARHFRGEDLKKSSRNKNCLWRACLFTDWDTISNLIEDFLSMLSAKFHFNLGSGLRREDFFRNRSIRNKNYLWLPCLQTDRDKISILLRGTSIDASYQFLVHFGKQFQRRRLKRMTHQKQELLMAAIILAD